MTTPTDATALVARVREACDLLDMDPSERSYFDTADLRALLSLVAQGEADRKRLEAMPVMGPITFSCGCQVMTRMEQRFTRNGENCDAPDHVLDAARATPTEGPTHG